MAEVFKPVEGYQGDYEVSNHGNVRSLKKARFHGGHVQFFPERILKVEKTYRGYQRVMLSNYGKYKKFYIHRLVAQHFLSNEKNKPQVNHINGRKFDNRACNLEWVTPQENVAHHLERMKMIQ